MRWFKRDEIETRLRTDRPKAPEDLVSRISTDVDSRRRPSSARRPALALALATGVLATLAGLGGVGYTADAVTNAVDTVTTHESAPKVQDSSVASASYPNPKYKQHTTPHHTNFNQGDSGNFTSTLVPKNGYTGAVTCTAHIVRNKSGNLAQYPTVTPTAQPAPVPGNAQWTVSTTSTTQPGQYTLKVICS